MPNMLLLRIILLGLASCLMLFTLLPSTFGLALGFFSFPQDGLSSSQLNHTSNSVVSSGILTLDARTSFSEASFVSELISLIDPSTQAALSFNSFFSWSTNSTYGNGTLAFFIAPRLSPDSVYQAIQGTSADSAAHMFAVEFNNSCFGNGRTPQDAGGDPYGERGHGYGGVPQVTGFANGTSNLFRLGNNVDQQWLSSSCAAQFDTSSGLYQYQVAVQYNASSSLVTVAMASCNPLNFMLLLSISQPLSGVLTNSMYVGFIAMGGGIFNISQGNFTSNATSSFIENLQNGIQTTTPNDPAQVNNIPGGPSSGSNSKTTKAYVVGFSVLGGGIGMAMVVGACFFLRKPREKRSKAVYGITAEDVAMKPVIPITKSRASKANSGQERDTTPLNPPRAGVDSAAFQVTGTASWVKPPTAR